MINTMQNQGDIPQAVIGSYLVTLDDNGRIKTDESRGVTNVKYNPLGLPSSITMGSEFTIINSYLSDGRLINETMREYYLAQVKRYDRVTGDTIIVYMPRLVSSVSRRHLGDFIIEAGKNPRSYHDWGYVEWLNDSTVQYYYYERDHQGSVRTVRNSNYGVVQAPATTIFTLASRGRKPVALRGTTTAPGGTTPSPCGSLLPTLWPTSITISPRGHGAGTIPSVIPTPAGKAFFKLTR